MTARAHSWTAPEGPSRPGSRSRERRSRTTGLLSWLLSVAVFLAGPGSSVALAQAAQDVGSVVDRLEAYERGAESVLSALPADWTTLEDLSFDMAFESPETITIWVREHVAFQPYRGVLRGAEGAVVSRAGNAWDRSLLLATLLADAGFEVRLARTELSRDQAQELVASMRTPAVPQVDDDAILDAYAGAGVPDVESVRDLADQARRDERALVEATRARSERLRDTLARAGIELAGTGVDALVEDARDYVWVQYRLGSDDPWTGAHSISSEPAAWTSTLDPDEIIEGSVPAAVQHRLRVRAVVERRIGDELETVPVMQGWERPAANLYGVPLSYMAVPDGVAEAQFLPPLEEAYAATSLVVPVFNDDIAPGAEFFDLLGNTVPPMAAASPAAGVFQSVGGAFGDAVGEVGGEEAVPVLTAHWLEFTLVAPGGEETTYRRTIVDRLGEARRAAGDPSGPLIEMSDAEIYDALMTHATFMIAPGEVPAAYVSERSARAMEATASFLAEAYTSLAADSAATVEPPDDAATGATEGPLLRMYGAFDDDDLARDPTLVSYRPEPSLVVRTVSWRGDREATDIVHNARRTVRLVEGGLPTAVPDESLVRGVWESSVEKVALTTGGDAQDAPSFFEAAEAEGIDVRAVPAGSDVPDIPGAQERALAAIAADLDAGYAVVVPGRLPDGASEAYWWRIDAATGETLGRGGDGRGQSLTETEALIIGLVISGYMGGLGFWVCTDGGGSGACCAADAFGYAIVGFGIGMLISSAVAGLAFGVAFDFGSGAAGMTGNLPSACSIGDGAAAPHDDTVVRASGPATCSAIGPMWAGFGRDVPNVVLVVVAERGGAVGAS